MLMSTKTKILAISGSLRKDSYNTSLLTEMKRLAPEGVEIEVYVPSGLPLFSQDLEKEMPKEAKEFKEKIKKADGLIFASPEHNYTISAAMKNAIEWGNRPWGSNSFFNKPAAIVGASSSHFGTVRAQNHMRQIFQDLSVITFLWPTLMISNAKEKFDDGKISDEQTKEKVEDIIEALVDLINNLPKDKMLFTEK